MSLSQLWEIVKDREAWRAAVHGDKGSAMTEQLNNHQDKMRSWNESGSKFMTMYKYCCQFSHRYHLVRIVL